MHAGSAYARLMLIPFSVISAISVMYVGCESWDDKQPPTPQNPQNPDTGPDSMCEQTTGSVRGVVYGYGGATPLNSGKLSIHPEGDPDAVVLVGLDQESAYDIELEQGAWVFDIWTGGDDCFGLPVTVSVEPCDELEQDVFIDDCLG